MECFNLSDPTGSSQSQQTGSSQNQPLKRRGIAALLADITNEQEQRVSKDVAKNGVVASVTPIFAVRGDPLKSKADFKLQASKASNDTLYRTYTNE